MSRGSKHMKCHRVWMPVEKRYVRLLTWFLRDSVLLPNTPIHVRRGNRVVVNTYTAIEAMRLYELSLIEIGKVKPEESMFFKQLN